MLAALSICEASKKSLVCPTGKVLVCCKGKGRMSAVLMLWRDIWFELVTG